MTSSSPPSSGDDAVAGGLSPRPPNGVKGSVIQVGRVDGISFGRGVIERCRPQLLGTGRVVITHHRPTVRPALLFHRAQMFVFKMGDKRGSAGNKPGMSRVVAAKLIHISGEEAHIIAAFVLSLI